MGIFPGSVDRCPQNFDEELSVTRMLLSDRAVTGIAMFSILRRYAGQGKSPEVRNDASAGHIPVRTWNGVPVLHESAVKILLFFWRGGKERKEMKLCVE